MADMQALFAEMRKAQTGGRDFAADAAAATADASSDGSSDEEEDEYLPSRAMNTETQRGVIAVSEFGKQRKKVRRDNDEPKRRGDPSSEASRHRAVSSIASVFESACGKTLGGRWWSHFENWLYSVRASSAAAKALEQRSQKGNSNDESLTLDPVLPDAECAKKDAALAKKLEAAGLTKYEIVGVGLELSKAVGKARAMLTKEHSAGKRKFVKMSAPFEVGGNGEPGVYPENKNKNGDEKTTKAGARKVSLTFGKVSLEVNVAHLEKLKALHCKYAQPRQHRLDQHKFKDDLFCVLSRYNSAQGGHYKAGAMQAAVPGAFLQYLHDSFDVAMELCASPLNTHWRRYCSAYCDIDQHFGSVGDVFKFRPTSGSFEANPPFDDLFIGKMVTHFEKLLGNTDEALSFCVVLPRLPTTKWHKEITASRFLAKRSTLEKGKHGFIAGGQQTRVARTTPSAAATDVIFLQNSAGKKKWPVTEENVKGMKRAFADGLKGKGKGKDDDEDDDGSHERSDSDTETVNDELNAATAGLRDTTGDYDLQSALRLSKGKVWDPSEFLFWGVGSGSRWGEQPSDWILDTAGEFLEQHWVGEDPESDGEEEEEEDEEEEGEEGEMEDDEESESDVELAGEDAGGELEDEEDGEDDDDDEDHTDDADEHDDVSDDVSEDEDDDEDEDSDDEEESDASRESESGSESEKAPPPKRRR